VPQGVIDAGYGRLEAWGQIASYEREHPGLAAALASDPAYRRLLITTLALYALVVPFLLHQVALWLLRRPRIDMSGRDRNRVRWFAMGVFAASFAVVLPLLDPLDGRRGGVIGPGPAGLLHPAVMFVGLVVIVMCWRALLMLTGRFPDLPPLERWPTRPWMKQYPTEQGGRG
jgi:hypothetical protein